jgi:hypothetical protein
MPISNHYYADKNNQINTPESATKLSVEGPLIQVVISLTPSHIQLLQTSNQPIPQPVPGYALIDTGAAMCSVDEQVISGLGSIAFGYVMVTGVTGGKAVPQLTYPASLSFPGTNLPNLTFSDFVGAPLRISGIIAIIGRSVLKDYILVYNGLGGHISLSY